VCPYLPATKRCQSFRRGKIDATAGHYELSHNWSMPVAGCFEERCASISVSVVDIGLCACRRQERLGYQRIVTTSGLKQLGASIVAVLFSSINTSTIRIEHSMVVLNGKKLSHLRDVSLESIRHIRKDRINVLNVCKLRIVQKEVR
jgi:hypothetical protein